MDTSREILDSLMGRDRNKPLGSGEARDHYSNRDVIYHFDANSGMQTIFDLRLF